MKQSTAMRLIQIVWDHNREGTGFSWERLNHSMFDAVMLAIRAGLKFNLGDFKTMAETMRIGYWGGNDGHMCGERFYRQAVEYRHPSAYQSFEEWKARKPFIWDGTRIYVGREFIWEGEKVTCTSFSADGSALIAVSYIGWDKQYLAYSRKIKQRYRITDGALRTARKEQRTP